MHVEHLRVTHHGRLRRGPIGDQCWFAENLRTTVYENGDSIPNVEPQDEWLSLEQTETGAWASHTVTR